MEKVIIITEEELEEIDRTARAFGWQLGSGKSIMVGGTLCTTEDNPFLAKNWKDVMLHGATPDVGEATQEAEATSVEGDRAAGERQDPLGWSGQRQEPDRSGLLPNQGGTG